MVDIGGDGATDVAADGSVVVGYRGLTVEAFRWTEETGIVGLGIPSGWTESVARGCRRTARSRWAGEFDSSPFIWDAAHGSRLLAQVLMGDYGLDLTGWRLDTPACSS